MGLIAGLVFLYVFAWLVLFFFPQLLHKKKTHHTSKAMTAPKGKMLVSAHRGGSHENYENSMSAFRHSIKNGITLLEMDIWKLKDGTFVVSHDDSIERITGQHKLLSEMYYEEIGEYLDEIKSHNTVFKRGDKPRERPGRFDDFLEEIKKSNVILSIDVKSNTIEQVEEAYKVIKKHNMQSRVLLGCIRNVSSQQVHAVAPDVGTFFSARDVINMFVKFVLGVLPFCDIDQNVLQMPFAFPSLEKEMRDSGLGWMYTALSYAKPIFILINMHLRFRGIPVSYFIVNHEEDIDTSISMGVDSVMTDRPEFVVNYLKAKGLC